MGQKVHPYGFRLGIIRDWQSRWFADKEYREFAIEDNKIRVFLRARLPGLHNAAAAGRRGSGGGGGRTGGGGGRSGRSMDAGVSQIAIERMANMVKVTLHTARPGLIIGRGGRGIDDLRADLEKEIPRKVQINVLEIKQPELDAYLVAESVAGQIERRVSFKRAIRLAIARTMQRGGKGIKVIVGGRLGGAEIARNYSDKDGKIPLHTLRADIDYGSIEARTQYGNIGVKVWIYRGEVLPGTAPQLAPVQRQPAPRPVVAPTPVAPIDATDKKAKGWRRVARDSSAANAEDLVAPVIEQPVVNVEDVLDPVIEIVSPAAELPTDSQPIASTENTEPGETA